MAVSRRKPKVTDLTVWSARLLQTLHKAHVFANVANTDYEGEISSFGDTVKINSVGPVTVSTYTKNSTTITPEVLEDAQTLLTIDQSKYFAFMVDDIDKAQQKPKVMEAAMREAGYALANTADEFLAGLHADAGDEVTDATLDEDTVYDVIVQTARKLDENDVPREGRFFVIPPFFHQYMVLAELLKTAGSIDANETNRNGYVGRQLGFDFYMSNNIASSGTDYYALAGTRRAISYAEQILSIEAYRPEDRFADAVKGLHVYGGKVVYPKALVRVTVDEA